LGQTQLLGQRKKKLETGRFTAEGLKLTFIFISSIRFRQHQAQRVSRSFWSRALCDERGLRTFTSSAYINTLEILKTDGRSFM